MNFDLSHSFSHSMNACLLVVKIKSPGRVCSIYLFINFTHKKIFNFSLASSSSICLLKGFLPK